MNGENTKIYVEERELNKGNQKRMILVIIEDL